MTLNHSYRPQTFSSTVGQDHIKTVLQQQIKTNSSKGNYIFFGPRGTGKTTTARIMAKALNCPNNQDGNPCNDCAICHSIDGGKELDIIEIDAASHTGVDNIREEIINKAIYPPSHLSQKVYIIDEVHMLSKGAFNALLKIMEEPPKRDGKPYLTFILATTEIHKVPETIISRCQTFQFRKLTVDQIVERLRYIAQQEYIQVEDEALSLIATTAQGIMRDAVKYLEQVRVVGPITVDAVTNYLGIVGTQQIQSLVELILSGDFVGSVGLVQSLYQGGVDLHVLARQMLEYADRCFLDSPDQMVLLTQLANTIVGHLRSMPTAMLAYKIALYDHLGQQSETSSHQVVATTTRSTPSSISSATPSASSVEASSATPSASTQEASGSDVPHDLEDFKKKLVQGLDGSAKSLIDSYVQIQKIQDHTVYAIVINKTAEISLKRNQESLIKLIEDILGAPHKIDFSFMSKDDYFASLESY